MNHHTGIGERNRLLAIHKQADAFNVFTKGQMCNVIEGTAFRSIRSPIETAWQKQAKGMSAKFG